MQRSRILCRRNFKLLPPLPPPNHHRLSSYCVKKGELKQYEIKDNGEEYEELDNDTNGGTE